MNHSEPTQDNTLSALLSGRFKITWEVAAYIVIFLLAVFTRFYLLENRVMSHDESLHTRFSYNLYNDGDFQHTPLMHGPILFHMAALSYSLFGDSDFSARIYTSIVGILMVMSPLLFRYWLKRWGTLIATVLMLISPLIMYYNRYIREDTPAIMATILMIWGMMMYLSGPMHLRRKAYWLYVIAFGMIWHLGTKETAFMYVAVFGILLAIYWFVRLAQFFANQRGVIFPGKHVFGIVTIGIMLGGVFSLIMYVILDIIQFDMVGGGDTPLFFSMLATTTQTTYFIWTVVAILAMFLLIFGTLFYVNRRTPWMIRWSQVLLIVGIMFASSFAMVVVEELSHGTPTSTVITQPESQPVPGEGGAPIEQTSSIRMTPLIATWVICIAACAIFIVYRRKRNDTPADTENGVPGTGMWGTLDLFPEFDVMIIIGTFILPWATALIPFVMRGTTQDYAQLAQVLPPFILSGLTSIQTIGSVDRVGIFFAGFMAWLPLMVTSIVIGLSWNPRKWLIAAGIFYTIFVFFFTTMFTNMQGLGTGMYYSLGYWLEQQGERRGSQPQYYYLLIIMPIYEFLPVIAGFLSMIAGMIFFWRRSNSETELELQTQIALAERAQQSSDDTEFTHETIYDEQGNVVELRSVDPDTEEHMGEDDKPKRDKVEEEVPVEMLRLHQAKSIMEMPFLIMWSWLAVFNMLFFTLAGEKMPWLGTHMTFPLIILAGWFLGGIVKRIDWKMFDGRGWVQFVATSLFIFTFIQVIGTLIAGRPVFQNLTTDDIRNTQNWIGSLVVCGLSLGVMVWIGTERGWRTVSHMVAIFFWGLLGILTFRAAWTASFINYDKATEFLVYAHSAPAVKTVLEDITEISLRTTDGMDLRFAYDNLVSWPYSWYFRDFPNAVYIGENPTNQNLTDAMVIVVGPQNLAATLPIVQDRYQRFDYIRMWWPMQSYFYLDANRVNSLFDFSTANAALVRQGIWDIWLNRDYSTYGEAIDQDFNERVWPVSNMMHVFVRKDVAAQVWNYGTGEGTVTNPLEQIEQNACTTNWVDLSPIQTIVNPASPLSRPIGLAVDAQGNLYVAEEGVSPITGNRISVFNNQGAFLRSYGTPSDATNIGQFTRPNAVTIAPNGDIYVVDTWQYQIERIDPVSGLMLTQWGEKGEFGYDAPALPPNSFWGPRDVKVDAQGNVFVSDTGNKRVRVYRIENNQAVHLYDIGSGGSGLGQLDESSGIAIHPTDGRVFVADTWNSRIAVFTRDGTFLNNYPISAWFQRNGNNPYIAIDATRDLLYVTDPDAGRILVLTTAGECVGSFGTLGGETPTTTEFMLASGVAVDAEGNIYVSDGALGRVLKFPPFPFTAPPAVGENANQNGVVDFSNNAEVTAEILVEETTQEILPEATAEATANE
jgi:uncharacterized protein (TIGR03663 family)